MTSSRKSSRGPGRPRYDQEDSASAKAFLQVCKGIALTREGALPLWRQLSDQLETAIRRGDLEPHSRIPSEPALCQIFGVSRPVVRSALGQLATDGLAVKMPRKGMFVGAPPPESDFITSNLSVFEDMVTRGHRVSTKTFDFTKRSADSAEQEAFGIGPDDQVVHIGRVYLIDDTAITCTRISLPSTKLPGFEDLDIEGRSIFGLIRERYDRRPQRAERWFNACHPTQEAAELMGLAVTTPMIWIESIAYEADGTPLEFYRAYYNSEAARIHIAIKG